MSNDFRRKRRERDPRVETGLRRWEKDAVAARKAAVRLRRFDPGRLPYHSGRAFILAKARGYCSGVRRCFSIRSTRLFGASGAVE